MEKVINRAVSLSLEEIAFTDHVDYTYSGDCFLHYIDYDLYIMKFNDLKKKYAEKIRLILGVEIGIAPNLSKSISGFANCYPFDYIIGSLHYYRGIEFDSPVFYFAKSKKQAYTSYFEEILASVKEVHNYDVLGHLDFIERYGRYNDNSLYYKDYCEVIDEILKVIIDDGKGIEINTSGIRYKVGHLHPQIDIIKRYKELGGDIITIGSDAHHSQDIYTDFNLVYQYLVEAGFKAISLFRNHKPVMVDIG